MTEFAAFFIYFANVMYVEAKCLLRASAVTQLKSNEVLLALVLIA